MTFYVCGWCKHFQQSRLFVLLNLVGLYLRFALLTISTSFVSYAEPCSHPMCQWRNCALCVTRRALQQALHLSLTHRSIQLLPLSFSLSRASPLCLPLKKPPLTQNQSSSLLNSTAVEQFPSKRQPQEQLLIACTRTEIDSLGLQSIMLIDD